MDHVMTDTGKLILRLALGLLVLLHGINKVFHGIGGIEGMVLNAGLPGALAYGVFLGEIVGPLLLVIGWYARIGALLITINMIFAFALAHMGDLFQLNAHGGWLLELDGMYLFTAIALALIGPGRFSLNGR